MDQEQNKPLNPRRDITGERFGRLTVVGRNREYQETHSKNCTYWDCICDCGSKTTVRKQSLLSGETSSCGCYSREILTNNLIGQRFGRLIVIDRNYEGVGKQRNVTWNCMCDCGKTIVVCSKSLTSGNTKSCGCLFNDTHWYNSNHPKYLDLTGKRFGNLTVIRLVDDKKSGTHRVWECRCDCGNTSYVSTDRLKAGRVKSCGCIKIRDLTDQRFGKLTAKRVIGVSKGGQYIWECQCECGNTTTVLSHNLIQGGTYSCGCMSMSIGEYNIKQLLDANNIKYVYDSKFFEDCINPETHWPLRYDFVLIDSQGNPFRLIEFDGEFHATDSRLQNRDNIKNQYAKDHNLPLVRLPVDKRNTMTFEDLMSDTYLVS